MASRAIPYFYNYYNNDSVSYPLIRLYGKWSTKTGKLKVTLNGNQVNPSWDFYDYDFKVFIILKVNKNDIVLTDQFNKTKNITIFYDPPRLSSSDPIVKLFLYDSFNGTGICDAPPHRNDNTLADNIKRFQLDAMLMQSFFAESVRTTRGHQEGLYGLPYATFQYEMNSSNLPVIHYLKASNPSLTRDYFWQNGVSGAEGLDVSSIAEGNRQIYYIGYTLTSHIDPATGKYGGWAGEAGSPIGVLNSGNLIWHARSLSEMQPVWNNTSNIDTKYNVFDNADTVSQSYSRILGSLMHEAGHCLFGFDHPSQMIALTSKVYNPNSMNDYGINYANPNNYALPFDLESFESTGPFGIMDNDADVFRNWFMAYDIYKMSKISYEKSELGSTGKGWWTPFEIKGYVNTCSITRAGYSNSNIQFVVNNQNTLPDNLKLHGCLYGTARYGIENNPVVINHPKLYSPLNNWTTFTNPNVYSVPVPNQTSFAIAFVWGPGSSSNKSGDFVKVTFLVKPTDNISVKIGNVNETRSFISVNGNIMVSARGGMGSSSDTIINRLCTHSIKKNGNINGIAKKVSFRHILPSIYSSPPASVGTANFPGCVMLNYVYITANYYKTTENYTNFLESFTNYEELNQFYNIENFTVSSPDTRDITKYSKYNLSILASATLLPHLYNETPSVLITTDSKPLAGRPAKTRV